MTPRGAVKFLEHSGPEGGGGGVRRGGGVRAVFGQGGVNCQRSEVKGQVSLSEAALECDTDLNWDKTRAVVTSS